MAATVACEFMCSAMVAALLCFLEGTGRSRTISRMYRFMIHEGTPYSKAVPHVWNSIAACNTTFLHHALRNAWLGTAL